MFFRDSACLFPIYVGGTYVWTKELLFRYVMVYNICHRNPDLFLIFCPAFFLFLFIHLIFSWFQSVLIWYKCGSNFLTARTLSQSKESLWCPIRVSKTAVIHHEMFFPVSFWTLIFVTISWHLLTYPDFHNICSLHNFRNLCNLRNLHNLWNTNNFRNIPLPCGIGL